MELQLNKDEPKTMHIDLNSCFATVEAQANPLLRGKPIAVAAGIADGCCIISPSYEAKRLGVKVGFSVREAKALIPEIIIIPPDPPKYRDVHQKFNSIFKSYSPNVSPLSIDEAVIDFSGTQYKDLVAIGKEIKMRMRKEIGEHISCNVGIGTNRFHAKLAASLHKPDGLDVITYKNLRNVLSRLDLIDLCGINVRNKLRLNFAGIYSPLEFLDTDWLKLKKQVFESILGLHWYMRLRGYEIDNVEWGRKSFGQSYALHHFSDDINVLSRLLIKLCEKMGRRLRRNGYYAGGIHVGCLYVEGDFWHKGMKVPDQLYSTNDLFERALKILKMQPGGKKLTHIMVSCYNLSKMKELQLDLFNDKARSWSISRAADTINDRYGDYTLTPALMMGMNDQIIDRVPFGGVRDIQQVYYDS